MLLVLISKMLVVGSFISFAVRLTYIPRVYFTSIYVYVNFIYIFFLVLFTKKKSKILFIFHFLLFICIYVTSLNWL